MRKRARYDPGIGGRMYLFFTGYDGRGVPSITKFAASVGMTTEELESFRRHRRFERAYRECQEIRRDYLIDRALDRRFDPSFTKFLLSADDERDTATGDGELVLQLEVKE